MSNEFISLSLCVTFRFVVYCFKYITRNSGVQAFFGRIAKMGLVQKKDRNCTPVSINLSFFATSVVNDRKVFQRINIIFLTSLKSFASIA